MFNLEEYTIAWSVYGIAVVGLILVFSLMTRIIPWFHVRWALRLILASFLLVPIPIDESATYWAPAWVKGALQLVFGSVDELVPIATKLTIVIALVLVVYTFVAFAFYFIKKQYQTSTS